MDLEWKYKIDVTDPAIFDEIEKERGISIPKELKTFIMKTNAATPSKYNFVAGGVERVLGAILSFNKGESDTDSVFTAFRVIKEKELIPFGIDPFGNYICYSLKDSKIVFWDHETDNVTTIADNLTVFLDSLY